MYEYPSYHNYDPDPRIPITGMKGQTAVGEEALKNALLQAIAAGKSRILLELYPGIEESRVTALVREVSETLVQIGKAPIVILESRTAKKSEETLKRQYENFITDDRVFGVICHEELKNCFNAEKLDELKSTAQAAEADRRVVVAIGTGAAYILPDADSIWYFDITRWEIQLRYRKGAGTWMAGVLDSAQLTKYKVGFFIEWRMADRLKKALMPRIDYWIDGNVPENPVVVTRDAFMAALDQTANKPFRMQAYYDPSVWGGQWMKRTFGLSEEQKNYGWSFDGVPEENCLKFDFGDACAVFPAIDLVLFRPETLLGVHVYGRFGAEFPIRFDFLDTMEGGNLSLQVHPLTEYIQDRFGMHYTQDESYYILDADENSCVYLGLKEGVDKEAFRAALIEAQKGEEPFDDARFVNCFPVKKHDHVLIPAGTVHCSGKNTVVLEISATPYIFTFKLWDWGRIGLDGRPRPIHIDHGMKNVQFDRTTGWVEANLLHQDRVILRDDAGYAEHTGLHEYEFIETERHTIHGRRVIDVRDSVTVLNLVDGAEAFLESTDGSFEKTVIHYAETFIVPASVQSFAITSEAPVKVMTARVR